jgi:prepilin-type N-terminal cleavage/methylation domain-containing protein
VAELFASYGSFADWQRGLLLGLLGLVVGSFCTMLRHRLPARQSILWPRSHCLTCQHTLGVLDLVPIISYLWLRGRCRYCAQPIPWRYLILEGICGLLAGFVGYRFGWAMGLAILVCCPGLVALWAIRQRVLESQAGFTMIEVLIALGLLMLFIIPMLDFGANMRGGTPFQRQVAVSLATTKLEELGNGVYRTNPNTWGSLSGSDSPTVGNFDFTIDWVVTAYTPIPNDFATENTLLRQATVTVRCINCNKPQAMPPVRMVAVLGKIP